VILIDYQGLPVFNQDQKVSQVQQLEANHKGNGTSRKQKEHLANIFLN